MSRTRFEPGTSLIQVRHLESTYSVKFAILSLFSLVKNIMSYIFPWIIYSFPLPIKTLQVFGLTNKRMCNFQNWELCTALYVEKCAIEKQSQDDGVVSTTWNVYWKFGQGTIILILQTSRPQQRRS
jgi:hypothetical protein